MMEQTIATTRPINTPTFDAKGLQNTVSRIPKSEKAAIIIALLGAEHAEQIIESLKDHHLRTFIQAMQNIQLVKRPILLATIAEFLQGLQEISDGLQGGEKQARILAETLLSSDRAKRILGIQDNTKEQGNEAGIWAKLNDISKERLLDWFKGQRPELVAYVFAKIGCVKTGEYLAEFSNDFAGKVVRQMAQPIEYDAAFERAACEVVKLELFEKTDVDDGSEAAVFIADVMGVLPKTRRDKLMDIIERDNQKTANRIRMSLITFEDLPKRLPKTAIPLIFRDMDDKLLLGALKAGQSVSPQTVEFLYGNISKRMAGQYQEQVEDMSALTEKQTDKAIVDLMGFISEQEKAGVISYISIDPEVG